MILAINSKSPQALYWPDSTGSQGWSGLALVWAGFTLFEQLAGGQVTSEARIFNIWSINL